MYLHTPKQPSPKVPAADALVADLTSAAGPGSIQNRPAAPETSLSPGLRRAIQLANQGDCKAALQLLRPQGHSPETLNAIGVCLMRSGQIKEAVSLYHPLVMKAGCTWMRPEVPSLYKLNFATALLLSGTPAGCLSALKDINEPGHPTVVRLQAAIKKWEASLSIWRRWDWRINHMEPSKCRVELDFVPGEFCDAQA